MADPHSLQLPSAADLVRAFVHDLGNVLEGQSLGSAKPTRTIAFTSSTTAIESWRADVDYFIIGYTANTTSSQVLSLDQTPTGAFAAADKVLINPGLIGQQSFAGAVMGMNFPLPAGSKLYWAPAASGQFCCVFLQYA